MASFYCAKDKNFLCVSLFVVAKLRVAAERCPFFSVLSNFLVLKNFDGFIHL